MWLSPRSLGGREGVSGAACQRKGAAGQFLEE